VALWAAIGSVAAACGPPVGGLLVQADWRWIFLVNLPIALPAVLLGGRLAERGHDEHGGLPDLFGAALLALGIAAAVAAISDAADWGTGSPRFVGCLVMAVIALGWFLRRCATHPRPVIDLALLRVREFASATTAMSCFYAGFGVMLLGGSLYLTQVWHYGSVRAGLEFAPGPLAATVFAVISSRLPVARHWLAVIGSTCFVVAGLFWFLLLGSVDSYVSDFLPALLLSGAGVGLSQASIMSAGAATLPANRYATGTGIINTARQIGSAIGVALLVTFIGDGHTAGEYRSSWLLMACCGLLAAVFAVAIRPKPGMID
jgi:hypothetical protein